MGIRFKNFDIKNTEILIRSFPQNDNHSTPKSYIKNYYEKRGFSIYKTVAYYSKQNNSMFQDIPEMEVEVKEILQNLIKEGITSEYTFKKLQSSLFSSHQKVFLLGKGLNGIPDFIVIKKHSTTPFFIEVKTITDSIRLSQLIWYKNHPKYKIKIIYVNIKEKERIQNMSNIFSESEKIKKEERKRKIAELVKALKQTTPP